MGYGPWGHKKSDTTEQLSTQHTLCYRERSEYASEKGSLLLKEEKH